MSNNKAQAAALAAQQAQAQAAKGNAVQAKTDEKTPEQVAEAAAREAAAVEEVRLAALAASTAGANPESGEGVSATGVEQPGKGNVAVEGAPTGDSVQETPAAATPTAVTVPTAPSMPVVDAKPVVTDTSVAVNPDAGNPAIAAGVRGVVVTPPKPAVIPDVVAKQAPTMPKPVDGLYSVTSDKVDMVLLDSEMERLLANVPPGNRMQVGNIVSYIKKCDPTQMLSVEAAAKANVGLWSALRLIINNEHQHFTPVFTAALRAFEIGSKGAMGEIFIYRGMDIMNLPAADRSAFTSVTTMMRLLAPVKSRAVILKSSINLNTALRNGLTQEGRNRVLAYFADSE